MNRLCALLIFFACLMNCAFAMSVKMLNVENGKAILIQTDTENILVDTGDINQRGKLPNIQIDKLILTHPHADHIANASYLIQRGNVKALYDNGQASTSRYFKNYLADCVKYSVPRHKLSAGDILQIDQDTYLECLNPDIFFRAINDNSLVLRLVYKNFSMLLTGDIEQTAEYFISTTATILDAPHHGSKTSSTLDFLKAVKPEYVLISCGEKYGHPHKQALENYLIAGVDKDKILCTRFNGDITITTDGLTYSVACKKVNWLDNYLGYTLTIRKIG